MFYICLHRDNLKIFKAVTTMPRAFAISITSLTCTKFVQIVVLWQKRSRPGVHLFYVGLLKESVVALSNLFRINHKA